MATYSILVPAGARPGQIDALEKAIPVKNGFRFWALAFPLFFVLAHRLWRPFLVLLALLVGLGVLAARDIVAEEAVLLLDLMIGFYAAIAASDWIVTARERQGYVLSGLAAGSDDDEALARFAHQWMQGQVMPPVAANTPATPMRTPQGPVIGLFPESGGR
jgi:hypothetical protein